VARFECGGMWWHVWWWGGCDGGVGWLRGEWSRGGSVGRFSCSCSLVVLLVGGW